MLFNLRNKKVKIGKLVNKKRNLLVYALSKDGQMISIVCGPNGEKDENLYQMYQNKKIKINSFERKNFYSIVSGFLID